MEPLFGYLNLAQKLYFDNKKKFVGSWNFGPNIKNNLKVIDVAKLGKKILNSKSKILTTKQIYYESEHLSLDSKKSLKFLNWKTSFAIVFISPRLLTKFDTPASIGSGVIYL